MQHADRFAHAYQSLRDEAGFFGPMPLVSAGQAAALVLAGRDELLARLPDAMKEVDRATSWISMLKGPIGRTLVALALVRGLPPCDLPGRAKSIHDRFSHHRIPRMGLWPAAAAGWLALEDDDAVDQALPRMGEILSAWKKDHPWITGHDDLHAAALHALGDKPPWQIRLMVEGRYVALKEAGFTWAPNTLQRAAQLAALSPAVDADALGERFAELVARLTAQGHKPKGGEREALALLAATPETVDSLASDYRAAVATLKDAGLGWTFGDGQRGVLAAGFVVADHVGDASQAVNGATLAAIIAAIQAATAAAVAASG